jgi:hypothetical protein
MEAYVHGVSTREDDNPVTALGAETGISKSKVSRICAGLDAEMAGFRDLTLATHHVFLRLPPRELQQSPGSDWTVTVFSDSGPS